MMHEKTGIFGLFVVDDVECFGLSSLHGEFYKIGDNFVADGDGGWRIKQFEGDEYDRGSIPVVKKFYLRRIYNELFRVCGSLCWDGGGAWWLDNVGSQFSNGWGIAPGIFRILLYGYDEH